MHSGSQAGFPPWGSCSLPQIPSWLHRHELPREKQGLKQIPARDRAGGRAFPSHVPALLRNFTQKGAH